MKLYVCYGTFPIPGRSHPCAAAHDALREAGYNPQVKRVYGWGVLGRWGNFTPGRREVKRLTGNYWVPALVLDDGTVVDHTKNIVAWAREHPVAG